MVPFLSKNGQLIIYRVDAIIHVDQRVEAPFGALLVPLGAIWFRK